MKRDRRGFTMVELLIVTVLGSLVIGAALQILLVNQRTYTAQTAAISGQQTTRLAIDVLSADLREVSPVGGDIIAMEDDSIRVRLMRKFGFVCATTLTSPTTLTVIPWGIGTNQFAADDSVFVFADNDPDIDRDDVWIEARVRTVGTGVCPQAAEPAQLLVFNGQDALFAADSVGIGAPVRSHRVFTYGTTTVLGDVYLGRRMGEGDMIPVAGPLRDTDGLEFRFLDELGDETSDRDDVRQIEVIIRTGSQVIDGRGGMVSDSIRTWIHLKN